MLWLYRRLIRQRQSEPALVMGRFEARRFSAEAKFGARLDWKPALAGAGSRSLRAERPLQSAGHCRPRVCWIREPTVVLPAIGEAASARAVPKPTTSPRTDVAYGK